MEEERRRSGIARGHFDILPGYTSGPASLQCFQRCFLSSETRCIMLRGHSAATITVSALARGINALEKAWSAKEDFAYASNLDNVYAY